MKIEIKSDLHLEFYQHQTRILTKVPPVKNKIVLILAGDLHSNIIDLKQYIIKQSKIYSHVLFITGNHDYYGGSINETDRELIKLSDENKDITFLSSNNPHGIFEKSGYVFIGDVLWSDFERRNPVSMWDCFQQLNDYRHISDINTNIIYDLHQKAKEYLIQMLEKYKDQKVIVTTHMAPSFESVGKEFKDSLINGGFASDMIDIILEYQPLYWFHGHMHQTTKYKINNTTILCNPVGYPHERDNGYNTKVIDLEKEA